MTQEKIAQKKYEIQDIEKHKYLYDTFKRIDTMCEQAKFLFFNSILSHQNKANDMADMESSLTFCMEKIEDASLTPIEQIFIIAFAIYTAWYIPDDDDPNKFIYNGIDCAFQSKEEIEYGNKKYIADFSIDFSQIEEYGYNDYLSEHPYMSKFKYIIELDGHEYHSTKKQRNNDYERENNLKELGYNVIRFTGSQVFNNPLSCVDKMIKIITSEIKKEDKR